MPRWSASGPVPGGVYPYLWVDATFVKGRLDGRVVSLAVVVAVGVRADEVREVLGVDVGPSEDGAFWVAFLRGLVARGLSGVQLVTSDAHEGCARPSGPCCTARSGSAVASLPAERAEPGAQGGAAVGGGHDSHRLRAAHR